MRVLHINANYIVSALHQTMVEHLNQLEVESKVFVATFDKNRSIIDCKEYVTVSECFKKWDRLTYFRKQRKIILSVTDAYDTREFDIIHAYTLFTDGNVAMELSKKFGIPYVVAIRNTDMNDFFKNMVHLRSHGVKIMRNASAVFFLSPAYRDTILTKYVPIPYRSEILKKSYIIPNGIDDFWLNNIFDRDGESIQRRIQKTKVLKCIFAGGIDKNKNIELTLKALEKANRGGWNCSLTSVGKIVDKSVYDRLTRYKQFRYVEPKKKEELIDYYRDADLFIMPSRTETFGLVYAEAMSQGLPVIYTRGQGFDGQFDEGTVGYSVDDMDADGLYKDILRIIDDYEDISESCLDSVCKFNWNGICNEYKSIYHEIVDSKR